MAKRQQVARVSGHCTRQKWDGLSEGRYPDDLTDMLRYDDCVVVDGTWIATGAIKGDYVQYRWVCDVVTERHSFTPGRWASFGIQFKEVR
jgi:hypothetical protein